MPQHKPNGESLDYQLMLDAFINQRIDKGARLLGAIHYYLRNCSFQTFPLDADDRQELLKQVAIRLLHEKQRFVGKNSGWLLTLIRAEYLQLLRRTKRYKPLLKPDSSGNLVETNQLPTASLEYDLFPGTECLLQILNKLAEHPRNRQALACYMAYAMGQNHQEIAKAGSMTPKTVGQNIALIKRQLKTLSTAICPDNVLNWEERQKGTSSCKRPADVFTGKAFPTPNQATEHSADSERQALLWHNALHTVLNNHPIPTTQQAERLYRLIQESPQPTIPVKSHYLTTNRWKPITLLLLIPVLFAGYFYTRASATAPHSQLVDNPNKDGVVPLPSSLPQSRPPLEFPELVEIPGGIFTMGCTPGRDDAITPCPEHEVSGKATAVAPFRLARHEVTVGQFEHFIKATGYQTSAERNGTGCISGITDATLPMNRNGPLTWKQPGFPQTQEHPVVCISWSDAQQYIQWLNQQTKLFHRLPTSAEWEYAARAGQETAYHWGNHPDRQSANFQGTGIPDQWEYTSPAGQFQGNLFGLHDMSGNASEWTHDCARINPSSQNECASNPNTQRVLRGGAWNSKAVELRSAATSSAPQSTSHNQYGFRIAQTISTQ